MSEEWASEEVEQTLQTASCSCSGNKIEDGSRLRLDFLKAEQGRLGPRSD